MALVFPWPRVFNSSLLLVSISPLALVLTVTDTTYCTNAKLVSPSKSCLPLGMPILHYYFFLVAQFHGVHSQQHNISRSNKTRPYRKGTHHHKQNSNMQKLTNIKQIRTWLASLPQNVKKHRTTKTRTAQGQWHLQRILTQHQHLYQRFKTPHFTPHKKKNTCATISTNSAYLNNIHIPSFIPLIKPHTHIIGYFF